MAAVKLTQPTPRRRVFCDKELPFPVPIATVTGQTPAPDRWCYFTGELVGSRVIIKHSGDMDVLYRMGFFGKASLSRFRPEYNHGYWGVRRRKRNFASNDAVLRVTSRRKYLQHVAWKRDNEGTSSSNTDGIEIRPLGVKKAKVDPPLSEEMAQSPEVEDEDKEKAETVMESDWPGQGEAEWPKEEEEDPWSTTCAEDAEDFWGVKSASGTTDPGADRKGLASDHKTSEILESATAEKNSPQSVSRTSTKMPSESELDISMGSSSSSETELEPKSQDDDKIPDENIKSKGSEKQSSDRDLSCGAPQEHKHFRDTVQPASLPSLAGASASRAGSCSPGAGDAEQAARDVDPLCEEDEDHADLYVVEDTDDSDCELPAEADTPWRPVRKREPHKLREYLLLTLEEAFFLSYGLGCLVVLDEDKQPMNLTEMWQIFSARQRDFVPHYIAYHSLRSRGWVPKEALKFGVHFLVYKHGPAFYHSSYCVLVHMVNETDLLAEAGTSQNQFTWRTLVGLNRTTEGVGKEVMLFYVIRPTQVTDEDLKSPKCIRQFKVKEVLMRRWISQQERNGNATDVMEDL